MFTDDGAVWKRSRNGEYVMKQMQKTKEWSSGLHNGNLNVLLRKQMCFSLQGRILKQKSKCIHMVTFYVWFDSRFTWKVHIDKIVVKCKKVLNVMRRGTGNRVGSQQVCFDSCTRSFC